jgi:hypothetical protein
MSGRPLLLLTLALSACGGGAAAVSAPTTSDPLAGGAGAKTHAIHLTRPSRVGERFHVVADDTTDKTIVQDGTMVQEKHRVLHLDAVCTTVAVDDRGRTTRDHYDVTELTADGQPLATGAIDVTRARKERDAVALVGGSPASAEVMDALRTILTMRTGGASDDDVFGTQQSQAVGAHWAVNTGLAHDDLLEDAGIDARTVTGDVWLAGVTRANDTDCLEVRGKLALDGIQMPDLPKGSVTDVGHADVDLEAALPFDARLARATESLTTSMKFRLRVPTPSGREAVLTVTMTSRRTARYSQG